MFSGDIFKEIKIIRKPVSHGKNIRRRRHIQTHFHSINFGGAALQAKTMSTQHALVFRGGEKVSQTLLQQCIKPLPKSGSSSFHDGKILL